MLKLELLAYNFHESLDLAPVFKEVLRILRNHPTALCRKNEKGFASAWMRPQATIVFQQVSTLALNGRKWDGRS